MAGTVNRDHVGGMAKLGDTRITRQINVAPSQSTTTEAEVKYVEAPFEAEKPLFELNASGLGRGEDEACEVLRFAHVFRCFSGFRNSPRSSICFGSLMMRSRRSLPVSG